MDYESYDLSELYRHLPEYVNDITEKRKSKKYNCPLCNSGKRENGTPAFNLYDDGLKCHCHSCGFDGNIIGLYLAANDMSDTKENVAVAIRALGKMYGLASAGQQKASKPKKNRTKTGEREHVYTNADGSIFGKKTVVSYSDGSKEPYWTLFDTATGKYTNGLNGQKAPLYNADILHNKPDEPVYITEGEKDAETIARFEGIATTIPNGAGFSQWIPLYNEGLQGRDIIILTDNDEPGRKYGDKVARNVLSIAKSVKVIPATAIWSDCPEKGDISDIAQALGDDETINRLTAAIQKASLYVPEPEQPTTSEPPELEYTVKRLSDVQPTPIKFIWYPYIPIGEITIMFAAGGTGKSFLTCGIAADITAGRTLPNPYEPQSTILRQNVLIISAEDDENVLHQRLVAAGADIDRCFTIAPPKEQEALEKYQQFELPCDAHDKKRINALKNAIRDYQAKLVIIDPWAAYVGKDTDMNRANSVRAITAELTVIAKEMDCAFLIVAHVNKKAQADNANDAVAGSADLVNGARSALAVRTFDDAESRVMIHTKCNYEALGKSVCYKIINQGKGKAGKFEWNGFCELTKEDLEDAARNGKKLKDIADDKYDEKMNRQAAIDIIKDLAVFGKKINVTYGRFRKLITDEYGIDFLPSKPTKFMNSLISDLRKSGITLERIGQRIRDDLPEGKKPETAYTGFVICCMTDGHLMADALPK